MSVKRFDVCVVGSGPAGIAISLALADRGLTVALVESGGEGTSDTAQRLSQAHIATPTSHSVMSEAVHRGLGGTSALWGGRCVPLDAFDFEARDHVSHSGWPLDADDLQGFYSRAAQFLGVGEAHFQLNACRALPTHALPLSDKFDDQTHLLANHLERWSASPNMWQVHRDSLRAHPTLTLFSGQTCIGFRQAQLHARLTEALVRPTAGGNQEPWKIEATFFVIACGGVESTRLVLNSLADPVGLKLEGAQFVGRYYMGHPSGKIADIELFGNPDKTIYGFERDGSTYVRRRITLSPDIMMQHKLLNTAFWLDNAPLSDSRHGSGVLSAAYLALTMPWVGAMLVPAAIRNRIVRGHTSRTPHVLNCLRSPFGTAAFCARFAYQRYLKKPRLPGFFTHSSTNRYALHFHAEQVPNWNSTISLDDSLDVHGMRCAKIALEWSRQDIESVINAHQVLDDLLQRNNIGRLIYRYPLHELGAAVHRESFDGFHQLGSLRMAADATRGVTDHYGRLFGAPNCYIASSATFPTSGQANPTLALVALSFRQAHHIVESGTNPVY